MAKNYYGKTPTQWFILTISSICFLILFCSQTVLVKYFDDDLDIIMPWLTCVLLTSGWPINGLIYIVMRMSSKGKKAHKLNRKLILSYIALGFLDAWHMALLSYGLNYLPGSTYMVVKSTSLVFCIVLSKIFIKGKILTYLHWVAVVILMTGVTILGLAKKHTPKHVTKFEFVMGFLAALGSAFANGAQIVAAEKLLVEVKKSRSFLASCEIAFLNGLASNIMILPFPFLTGEFQKWGPKFREPQVQKHYKYFVLGAVGIGLSKQLGYLFKFGVTGMSSALYAEMLDMLRRSMVIVLVVIIYNEYFGPPKAIAMSLMLVGLGFYVKGGTIVRKMQKKRAVENRRRTTENERARAEKAMLGLDLDSTSSTSNGDSTLKNEQLELDYELDESEVAGTEGALLSPDVWTKNERTPLLQRKAPGDAIL